MSMKTVQPQLENSCSVFITFIRFLQKESDLYKREANLLLKALSFHLLRLGRDVQDVRDCVIGVSDVQKIKTEDLLWL